MTEKERIIKKYMTNLGLSFEEAEELYADEMADNLPTLSTEQKAIVREMTQADRKKETTPRKRERKIDSDKRFLIALLVHTLTDHDDERFGEMPDATATNPEREIEFTFHGEKYRLTLSKPRK